MLEVESTFHSAAGRIRSIEKFSDLIKNRTRVLMTRRKMPQPTAAPRYSDYEKLENAQRSAVVKALCYKPEDRGLETR
jgi:hypothetical protein